MKKTAILLSVLFFATGVAAQNPTAYFMEGSTLRSQFNPAFAPLQGYVNVPGLGGINIGTNGNLSIDKLLYPKNGRLVTLLDSSVSASQALSGLQRNNFLTADTRVNLIGFGAFTSNHRNFWSFDLNLRTTAEGQLPYTLFEFLKKGVSNNISGIGINAESYLEAGFAYSFPLLNDRLYVGVRGKFLVGAGRTQLRYDRFNVSMQEDKWVVDASGQLDVTLAGTKVKTAPNDRGEQVFKPGDLDLSPSKPSGYGFAVDLGATYEILPELHASLGVTDLGFISWSKKHTITGRSSKMLEFSGVEVSGEGTAPQPSFDINVLEFMPAEAQSTTRMLRASINAGLEYQVWRHKIGIGLLYTAHIQQYRTQHNITGSVNFHPVRWFTVTGSYSVIENRGHAVGLGLNLNPGWINFFIATDVLTSSHTPQFVPIKQNIMNLTLGLGVPIGRRSHRIPAYVYDADRR